MPFLHRESRCPIYSHSTSKICRCYPTMRVNIRQHGDGRRGETKMFPLDGNLAVSAEIQQTLGNGSLAAANIVALASLLVSAPLLKINRPEETPSASKHCCHGDGTELRSRNSSLPSQNLLTYPRTVTSNLLRLTQRY